MTSKLIETEVKKKIVYPCLMRIPGKDVVVAFTGESIGCVVATDYPPNGRLSMLSFQDDWEMSGFTLYHGKVELSN